MQDVRRPVLRWSGALAIVLALHASLAWWLLHQSIPPMVPPPAPEAVMLDLAPDLPPVQPAAIVPPAAAVLPPPPAPPAPTPPPPPETPPVPETPPIPVAEPPPVELPPTPTVEAEVAIPVPPPPPPRPQPAPKPRLVLRPVVRQPAPPVPEETPGPIAPAPAQAAPAQRPAAPASNVTPTWRNELLARLQRAKRYPDMARSRGDQGVATVTFTMDRGGHVVGVSLVRSSGSSLLDDEAVALVRRAEPLPSLPDDMPGSSITLTVPISFALR